jgi:hypothetical protein
MLLKDESIEEIFPRRDLPDKLRTGVREPHRREETADSDGTKQREAHRLSHRSRARSR